MADIARLATTDSDFAERLDALLAWESVSNKAVQQTVDAIIDDIRARGDAALIDYTARFDGWQPGAAAALEIPTERLQQALDAIPSDQREALETASARIRAYAQHQRMQDWEFREADGTLLGQKVTPLDRVGLYVPGGKAAYPSSVLMNAIPGQGRRRGGTDHGGADPERRAQRAWCWPPPASPASTVPSPSAGRRRSRP